MSLTEVAEDVDDALGTSALEVWEARTFVVSKAGQIASLKCRDQGLVSCNSTDINSPFASLKCSFHSKSATTSL